MHTIGSKYKATKDLDVADIAKLIRTEIVVKHPGIKTSVRIDRYAGGQSIDIVVKAVPFKIEKQDGRLIGAAKELLDSLDQIHSAYNFDDSDTQADYFHVRFYGRASFDWRLEHESI